MQLSICHKWTRRLRPINNQRLAFKLDVGWISDNIGLRNQQLSIKCLTLTAAIIGLSGINCI